MLKTILRNHKVFLFILFSSIILQLYFINLIPYLDGNIDFIKSFDLFTGGITQYINNWTSVHPPFKFLIFSFIFNFSNISYIIGNFLGILVSLLGIIFFYLLTKTLINKSAANTAVFLLAFSPLYLSNSIFADIDFIVCVLSIISLYFYSKKRHFLYGISTCALVLTKETGLTLPTIIFLVEGIFFLSNSRNLKLAKIKLEVLYYLLPFFASYLWFTFLKLNNKSMWQDWIFSDTSNKGAIYTVFYNIFTLHFLNKYAYQQWFQFFVFNFNWIYSIICIIGIILFLSKRKNFTNLLKKLKSNNQPVKTLIIITLYFIIYLLAVLSFQTYTIPRYALPIAPIFIIFIVISITKINETFPILKKITFALLICIIFSSLSFSFDPISTLYFGKMKILGQDLYALPNSLAGNDGITYNAQFLLVAKKRTDDILKNQNHTVYSNDCFWIFPDPNNDYKTIKILNLDIDTKNPCQNLN